MMHSIPSGLPIISMDDGPLGEWSRKNGFQVWSGEPQWLQRDGDVHLLWSHGKVTKAWNVRGPDGVVGDCERLSPTAWRFWSASVVAVGTLSQDHRTFTLQVHAYQPPGSGFEAALWRHIDFRALIRLRPFMGAVFAHLTRNTFRADFLNEGRLTFTADAASSMLSRMRGWGDGPMELTHPSFKHEAHHAVMFEEVLEDIGWHALTPEEFAHDHGVVLALMREIDERPRGYIPIGLRPVVLPLRACTLDGGEFSLSARLIKAMNEGRCAADEVETISALLDYDEERLLADPELMRGL